MPSPQIKAMILAAGYGLRARPLTMIRPKPLFPVLDRPLLSCHLDRLVRAGVEKVVVNTHHLAGEIEKFLARGHPGLDLTWRREESILGTGGGLKNVGSWLGPEPFLLINGDVLADLDLAELLASHLSRRPAATLVLRAGGPDNVAVDAAGMILGFRGKLGARGRRPEEVHAHLTFTGLQVVDPEIFSWLPTGPSDIIETYQTMLEAGRPILAMIPPRLDWWDLGTLERYVELHSRLLRAATQPQWVSPQARVHPRARLEGWVCLGTGTEVEAGALVRDSVLWPGARVAAGARVVACVLADGAVARTDARGQALVDQ